MMYDVYIRKLPRQGGVQDDNLNALIENRKKDNPFWLGLSRDFKEAALVAKMINDAGGSAAIEAEEYRSPKINVAAAEKIAQKEIARIRKSIEVRSGNKIEIESVEIDGFHDSPRVWVFIARSPTLVEQGYMPGNLVANIDKISGEAIESSELLEFEDRVHEAQGIVFDA